MKDNYALKLITFGIILCMVGWVAGLKTEEYLIKKGIHRVKVDGGIEYVKPTDVKQWNTPIVNVPNDSMSYHKERSAIDHAFHDYTALMVATEKSRKELIEIINKQFKEPVVK